MRDGEARSDRREAFLIFAAALIFRAAYLLFFSQPGLEVWKYQELALRFRGVLAPPPLPFFSSPGYIGLVALFQGSGGGMLLLKLAQGLVDAGSCYLICLLGRRWFGAAVSRLAGLGAVAYQGFLLHSATLLPAVWIVFFNLLALWFLTRWKDEGKELWLGKAGLALGLSLILRPNIFIFILGTGFWLLLQPGRRRGRRLACLGIGVIIPLAPVTAWNARTGELIPVTASGGWVFFSANNKQANGFSYSPPRELEEVMTSYYASPEAELGYVEHLCCLELARSDSGLPLTPGQASSHWARKGWEFFRDNPRRGLILLLRKTQSLISAYEPHDLPEVLLRAGRLPRWAPGPGWVIPLALLGLLSGGLRGKSLLGTYLAAYLLGLLLLYVTPRYRLPLLPVLLLLAADVLVRSFSLLQARAWGKLGSQLLVLILLAGVSSWMPQALRRDRDSARPAFLEEWRGLNELRNGEKNKAKAHFLRALRMNPSSFRARCGLNQLEENEPS